ncbi:hypothetical protein MRB53_018221 [Persea americana]|uniref:Uncharacterized protein n=1 Tax=Persea americana TaxID=3435 RepID=A0ACC2M7A6_PERAE|nr:hypothetical protein MRB53_018221 [Persea americana]
MLGGWEGFMIKSSVEALMGPRSLGRSMDPATTHAIPMRRLQRLKYHHPSTPPITKPPSRSSSSSSSPPDRRVVIDFLQRKRKSPNNEQQEKGKAQSPDEWNDEELRSLLSSASFTQTHLLQVIRALNDTQTALRFIDWASCHHSPPLHGPSAFQTLFDAASRRLPNPHLRLQELLHQSRLRGLPLTADSASLLIHSFSAVGWVSQSLQILHDLKPHLRKTPLYNHLLHLLFKSDRPSDALSLAHHMLDSGRRPNQVTGAILFSALLKRSNHGVDEDSIARLVLELGRHGVFPDTVQLTQWITRLCQNCGTVKAWDLLHALKDLGAELQVPSFNALLASLGRERDFHRMNLLLAEMKEMGVEPSVITYGILINQLWRQEEGLGLMGRMLMQYNCSPNTVTYNCLIDGFCKAGEIDNARELFDGMTEQGVPPNVITMNTIVDGMCKNGRISSALQFFKELRGKGLEGNAVTYCSLIGASLHVNNVTKAMELFEEMVNGGISPDSVTYFTLISGLSQAGRLEEASSVASSMEEAGFHLDVASYNVLISGFCRKKKFEEASKMLKRMEEAGVKPDEVTYNTLIAALCKGGDILTANEVMSKMIEEGCVPSVVTYGALIHGHCKVGNLDEALKLFRSKAASGIRPNTVIYNILIDYLCKGNELDTALSLMDEMRAQGVFPTATTYNSLFKGLRDRNLLDKAYELMDQMNEQGCNPDYITVEILTEWLSAVGETTRKDG